MKINILSPFRVGGPYNIAKHLVGELNERGFQAQHIKEIKDLLFSPLYQNADIIHAMDVPLNFRIWNKPVLLTIQGDYSIQPGIWQPFFPLAVKMADTVVTSSEYLKQRLGTPNAIVIPNGINITNFKIAKISRHDKLNLITLTKFYFEDKAKGVLDLVDILNSLPNSISNRINKLIVLGHGNYLADIKNQCKSKIKIEFPGWVSDPKSYLQNSDIFCYYSNHDVFPTSILEAMATGLPIISNKVGAIGELMGKTGFICDNKEAYKAKLIKMIKDIELRKQKGLEARTRVKTHFTWDIILKKYIEIYNKLKRDYNR